MTPGGRPPHSCNQLLKMSDATVQMSHVVGTHVSMTLKSQTDNAWSGIGQWHILGAPFVAYGVYCLTRTAEYGATAGHWPLGRRCVFP